MSTQHILLKLVLVIDSGSVFKSKDLSHPVKKEEELEDRNRKELHMNPQYVLIDHELTLQTHFNFMDGNNQSFRQG